MPALNERDVDVAEDVSGIVPLLEGLEAHEVDDLVAGDRAPPPWDALLEGYVDRQATLNGLIEIGQQLLERLAFRGATRNSGDFSPESAFFGLVYHDLESHGDLLVAVPDALGNSAASLASGTTTCAHSVTEGFAGSSSRSTAGLLVLILRANSDLVTWRLSISCAIWKAMTRLAAIASASPIIVTRKASSSVVMISLDDYEALEETAYLLRSPKNARRLLEAIAELEAGGGTAREEYLSWQKTDRKLVQRITDEHRIVYKVEGDAVLVAQLRYHY